jgi:hypothetical protein
MPARSPPYFLTIMVVQFYNGHKNIHLNVELDRLHPDCNVRAIGRVGRDKYSELPTFESDNFTSCLVKASQWCALNGFFPVENGKVVEYV